MSKQSPLWITEAEVVHMMDMNEAIKALEKGLLAEAAGEASNMVKTHVAWGNGSTLHAIGAVFPQEGFVGTKTWAHTEGGATPLLILFDSETGALKAIIEAFALGQMRTGSAAGVATRWLAAEDADEFAIIGTGKQAITQVAAVASLVAARGPRDPSHDLTLFKSLGVGISDLALGMELYRQAVGRGIGRGFPQPRKVSPRLRAGKS